MRATLEGQPGVESVEVDFDNKTARVVAGPDFDSSKAAKALVAEGFGATIQ